MIRVKDGQSRLLPDGIEYVLDTDPVADQRDLPLILRMYGRGGKNEKQQDYCQTQWPG
jgi:hypothetical protein